MPSLIPEFILEQQLQGVKSGSFVAATLFMDVSGFTAITEQLLTFGREGVETISDVLEFIFGQPVKTVYGQHGFITSFLGDAFTGVFIAENEADIPRVVTAALYSVLEIRNVFKTAFRSKFGEFKFDVKIGLSLGKVDWGILGAHKEKSYYFSGTAITNCATGESIAADGEIWCDDSFRKSSTNILSTDLEKSGYFRISAAKQTELATSSLLTTEHNFPLHLLEEFAGKHELNFANSELRDVSTVYLAFADFNLIDNLMSLVFALTKQWGGSHPHLYYGDKGWNLVVFFGAPTAYGNHPDRALNFLLALKNQLPKDFLLKGGITSGKLFAGFNGAGIRKEFTCLGSKVNLACRFMVYGQWNEFLCDEETAKEAKFDFQSLGEIPFKGNLSATPTFKLLRAREAIPVNFANQFIGRKEELNELNRAVTPIFHETFGGIYYIDGMAGVGKSRLIHEFKNQLTVYLKKQKLLKVKSAAKNLEAPFFWLHLPCDEILKRSFHPVIYFLKSYFNIYDNYSTKQKIANFNQIFSQLIDSLPRGELKELLFNRKKILQNHLINVDAFGNQKTNEGRDFYEGFIYTIKALLRAMSQIKPVIIHLEDAQWIDDETERFLANLTANSSRLPLIILASSRYSEDGLKIKLKAKQAVSGRLRLKTLNFKESFALTETIVRKELKIPNLAAKSEKPLNIPIDTFDRIWDISEGNPYIIEQLVTYLGENNYLNSDLSLKIKQLELPSTINAVTIARIDKLSPLLKETIKAAAVLGKEFDITILSGLTNHKSTTLKEILQEGYQEAIWQPVNETHYVFTQTLLRNCAYQMQLNRHLKELHLKTAELLAGLHGEKPSEYLSEIAYHYETGEVVSKAIRYYELAGDNCACSYRNSEAIAFYDKLLNHFSVWRDVKIENWQINSDDSDNRLLSELKESLTAYLRNLLKKAEILHFTGHWVETESMYKEILTISNKIGNAAYLALGYHNLGRYFQTAAEFDLALKYYKKARRQYLANKDLQGILSILTNLGDICEKRRELKKAARYYHFQLKLAEIHHNRKGLADAYWKIGNINLYSNRFKSALGFYQKKLTISEELNDKHGIAIALNNMALIYAQQNDTEKTLATYQRQLAIVKDTGDLSAISRAYCNLSQHYLNFDQPDEAEAYINKALVIDRELNIHASLMISTLFKAELFYQMHDHNATQTLAQESLHHARIVGDPEIIERSSRLLKKNHFMLMNNRKTRIEYIKTVREELSQSDITQKMILEDNLMLFEFHCVANYQKKSTYNTLLKLLSRLRLTKTAIRQITIEADKLLNKKWNRSVNSKKSKK